MRYKKSRLIARRNKILPIQFVRRDMTTYSGLTLVEHYLRLYRIHQRLSNTFKSYNFNGDYKIGHILYLLLIMLLVGAERLQHLEFIKNDPLFCRVVGLTRIPHRTKVSTALKQFTSDTLKALIELNSELVVEKIEELGLNEITIDLDGTVISTRGNPSWAFKGYNPIKKGAKSYFPLTAHIGETGHFLTILNRPGNVHDSNRALHVIQMIRRQIPQFDLRFRGDSAFCDPQILNDLLYHQHAFAIKAPFWKLLNLKGAAKERKRWFKINKKWSYFWIKNPIEKLDYDHYVMILRKNVHKSKKQVQLEFFSPNDGVHEYSAVVTDNKDWSPKELLNFVSGRSAQENSIGQLKTNFAFDHIPTNNYQANTAYMQMNQMAYNLSISMQYSMGLAKKQTGENKKHTRIYRSMKWGTFRFLILNRAGLISWNNGKKVLEMTRNIETKNLYDKISESLDNMKLQKAA